MNKMEFDLLSEVPKGMRTPLRKAQKYDTKKDDIFNNQGYPWCSLLRKEQ